MDEINKINFDYYYGKESEQFNFYRIPKLLFSDKRFKSVSTDAKVLYGLMLDRMSLSIKNEWIDDENRVYIYFTLEDVMDFLSVGKDKALKLFAELDVEKGVGLIKRKRQGLGKPMMIYVMNFNSGIISDENEEQLVEVRSSENPESDVYENAEVQTSVFQESGLRKKRTQDFCNSGANNTEYNNTDVSYNNRIISINHNDRLIDVTDAIKEREEYKELIQKNIDYESIIQNYSRESADGILEMMLDVVCSKKDYIIISGSEIPWVVIKNRFLKLNYTHIEYVLDCLMQNTTKICNIKSYMITTLYNSFATIDQYYRAKVNYDMHGCK